MLPHAQLEILLPMGNAKRVQPVVTPARIQRLAPNVTPPIPSPTLLVWTPVQWVTSNTMEFVKLAVQIVIIALTIQLV